MSRGPWRDSTRQRVRQFFIDNPDEELNYPLLMAKFGLTRPYAVEIVKILKTEGLIEGLYVIRNRQKGIAQREEKTA